ncbi:MAG: hypothetical protein ACUVQY_10060 [Thermoproteota archaeon]
MELELKNASIFKRTAMFLIEHRDPDGSRYELKEKLEKSPQDWLSPDMMDNRLWFTVSLTVFLMASGFEFHPTIKKSSDYLSEWWDEQRVSCYMVAILGWHSFFLLILEERGLKHFLSVIPIQRSVWINIIAFILAGYWTCANWVIFQRRTLLLKLL